MLYGQWLRALGAAGSAALALGLQGCTAVTAGQLAQAGYDAAKTSLTNTAGGAEARQARSVVNSLSVGQDLAPVLDSIGMPPKEKSGNLQGYVCYQYAGVYSATEDAVIVAKDGKIVFFGSSTCRTEMLAANFNAGGKYAAAAGAPAGPAPASGDGPAGHASGPSGG